MCRFKQLAGGTFYSKNESQLTGNFRFVQEDGKIWLETSDNFRFSGSPSPGWVLMAYQKNDSRPNIFDAAMHNRICAILPPSRKPYSQLNGQHRFAIPEHLCISEFNCLIAWCYGRPELLGLGMFGDPSTAEAQIEICQQF
ncbi:hypothetical protein [Cohaesibacter gelatinilyticus]|uniref:Uncharacterized protein n=1 Tax=Cohaesibacter gelatinilyticus TaxID=372072 RepID=A0A285PCR6_9HYPH|nr:hypothetical protein [Cohaesibacter gelatinilyticus]SNZ19037.1 hypothetical protein SAMN06265368_2114 [Cohaesibacter gelatinilyticus]HAT85784.1 hypothetical protein [Hyphomicrobiales bacterium]